MFLDHSIIWGMDPLPISSLPFSPFPYLIPVVVLLELFISDILSLLTSICSLVVLTEEAPPTAPLARTIPAVPALSSLGTHPARFQTANGTIWALACEPMTTRRTIPGCKAKSVPHLQLEWMG